MILGSESTRGDCIDSDPSRSGPGSEILRETDQTMLVEVIVRRRSHICVKVVAEIWGYNTLNRANIDDGSSASLHHGIEKGPRDSKHSSRIDLHGLAPSFESVLIRTHGSTNTVVNQNIE